MPPFIRHPGFPPVDAGHRNLPNAAGVAFVLPENVSSRGPICTGEDGQNGIFRSHKVPLLNHDSGNSSSISAEGANVLTKIR